MLHRTKKPEIKLKRTVPKKLETDPNRDLLIRHVLIYFPHWKNTIHTLSNKFLLMHVHPMDRWSFKQLFNENDNN